MSVIYGPKLITDGLQLYLDAEKSYPGTGNIWYDFSNNNYNGTINGTLSYNNKYLTFNGTQYVTTTASPETLGIYDADFTFEALASFSSVSSDQMIFGNLIEVGDRDGLHLGVRDGVFFFGLFFSDTSAGSASINTIYHMTWTFEKGISTNSAKIWINGSNISGLGANIGPYLGTTNIMVGAGWNTVYLFNGNLYYTKIYNRLLTSNEIFQNYTAAKGRFGL